MMGAPWPDVRRNNAMPDRTELSRASRQQEEEQPAGERRAAPWAETRTIGGDPNFRPSPVGGKAGSPSPERDGAERKRPDAGSGEPASIREARALVSDVGDARLRGEGARRVREARSLLESFERGNPSRYPETKERDRDSGVGSRGLFGRRWAR